MWAPMHAWWILVHMQAVKAVEPLTKVFDWSEDSGSDLINEGLTDAFLKFGPPAIEPLASFIHEGGHAVSGYIGASEVMAGVAVAHPEHRARIIQIISSALEAHFEQNDEDVNGFWISDLLDLKAVESSPVIKKAFDSKRVNLRVAGDLEDVELEFGMREKRDTPARNLPQLPGFSLPLQQMDRLLPELHKADTGSEKKKEKNKRKQEKKSRRKNRKKK